MSAIAGCKRHSMFLQPKSFADDPLSLSILLMLGMLRQTIATLRSKASGNPTPPDDFGVTNGTLAGTIPYVAVIAPDDIHSIAFPRSPAMVSGCTDQLLMKPARTVHFLLVAQFTMLVDTVLQMSVSRHACHKACPSALQIGE